MLIRFTCENAFCFKEEIALSMIATSDKKHPNHITSSARPGGPNILRAAGVYGANGHGKTKLVDAIFFLKRMACGSDDEPIKSLVPFKLASESKNKPSRFVVSFRMGAVEYEYGLIISQGAIDQEWLYETEKRQEVMLFTRERRIKKSKSSDTYNFQFGPKLRDSKSPSSKFDMLSYLQFLAAEIKDSETFLSKAAERKVKKLRTPYNWFCDVLQIVKADAQYGSLHFRAAKDEKFLTYLSDALCKSDTGLGRLKIKKSDVSEEVLEKLPIGLDINALEKIKEMSADESLSMGTPDGPSLVIQKSEDGYSFIEFVPVHRTDEGDVEFEIDDESSGTRRLMDLYPMLYSLTKGDKVYIVDELDRKLHPLLAYNFVKSFLNQDNGQLIFTTHTTHLLDLDLLRRDEVWLVQKKETGSSEIYSLSDFKVRPDLDIRKGYLQGRFGGVPFFGDTKALGW